MSFAIKPQTTACKILIFENLESVCGHPEVAWQHKLFSREREVKQHSSLLLLNIVFYRMVIDLKYNTRYGKRISFYFVMLKKLFSNLNQKKRREGRGGLHHVSCITVLVYDKCPHSKLRNTAPGVQSNPKGHPRMTLHGRMN